MLKTSHEYWNEHLDLYFHPVSISHWYDHFAVFGWARYAYEDQWFPHIVETNFDDWQIFSDIHGWGM